MPSAKPDHGLRPGESRFLFDEKMRLAKHYPLGELIVLDRERCIQCARCIRFQDDIVDDPVIGFSQRGRALGNHHLFRSWLRFVFLRQYHRCLPGGRINHG
jgi:polyferredoxin